MTAGRIGDRELGRQATKQSRGLSRMARLSATIASPLAVLTLLPLLVASIGLFLTWVGQRSLRESNLTMASDRIDEETTLLARGISAALEQSDPVMDRLSSLALDHDPIKGFDRAAHSLRDLMQGRPGVSYISVSFPDGTFQGAYRDEDGSIRFQDSRVTSEGTVVKRYTLIGHERITPYYEERSSYDPREREFYKLGEQRAARLDQALSLLQDALHGHHARSGRARARLGQRPRGNHRRFRRHRAVRDFEPNFHGRRDDPAVHAGRHGARLSAR